MNTCYRCGKPIKGKLHSIPCRLMDETHGKDCNCAIPMGYGCFKSTMNEYGISKSDIEKFGGN